MRLTIPKLLFTEADAESAYHEWGCNCGPSAMAASAGITLAKAREAVEKAGFAEKRYTSPSMMDAALRHLGIIYKAKVAGVRS